jgi:hypothetical protein
VSHEQSLSVSGKSLGKEVFYHHLYFIELPEDREPWFPKFTLSGEDGVGLKPRPFWHQIPILNFHCKEINIPEPLSSSLSHGIIINQYFTHYLELLEDKATEQCLCSN